MYPNMLSIHLIIRQFDVDATLEHPTKQSQVKTLEKQIDQFVYKLYDLIPEEIAIVENFNKGK